MSEPSSNIVLVGMPGSGKSTVGVILAKLLSRAFVDTDLLIQTSQACSLQTIVDRDGYIALRQVEEEVLLGLDVRDHVIATGGSAVYSDPAMRHLRASGTVVFLDADLATLESRVHDFGMRGLAKRPGQSFGELFAERRPLYLKYADITVDCCGQTQEDVCAKVVEGIGS